MVGLTLCILDFSCYFGFDHAGQSSSRELNISNDCRESQIEKDIQKLEKGNIFVQDDM